MHTRNLEVEAIDNHGKCFFVKSVNTSGIKAYKQISYSVHASSLPMPLIAYAFDFTLSIPYIGIDSTCFQCW